MTFKAPAIILAVLASSTGLVAPVRAGDAPSYTIEDVKACSRDALRLCKSKLADLDAIEACMRENYAALSPACQSRFKGR